MPYILAPRITQDLPGLWAEGAPYSKEVIYDICSGDLSLPPVHYESHQLKPHSLCRFDAPGHIIPDRKTMGNLFRETPEIFYGPATVVRLRAPRFEAHARAAGLTHYEVTRGEL